MPCYNTKESDHGLLKTCIWRGLSVPCSQIFKAVPSDIGICCAFNMKKAEEVFKESQYRKSMTFMQMRDLEESREPERSRESKQMNFQPQAGRKKGQTL